MTKEEDLENEDMDSDFDETDHGPMNNGHNNHHSVIKINISFPFFNHQSFLFLTIRKTNVWTKD
jgi:hypothetical protein